MKKAIVATIIFSFLAGFTWAQADYDNLPQQGEAADRVKAMKTAFITSRLNLSTEESEKFWPLYNEYEVEQKKIREKYKFSNNFATMTDAEAERMVTSSFEMEQLLLNLKKDYFQKFRKVIPVRKIAMLNRTERDFREQLVKTLQDLQMNRKKRFNGRN